jgi:hypothetical protein
MAGNKFYVPHGVSERMLESGRPLVPGETITLSREEEEKNARLIEEDKLLRVEPKTNKKGE